MKIRPYARVIVEGMDGSGKTTLVRQLDAYFGEQVIVVPGYNRTPDPKSPMPQWWMEQLAVNRPGQFAMHDRFFYPELVYGPVLRGSVNAEKWVLDYVLKFLRAHAMIIYCRPPTEVITRGIEVEDQMEGVKPHLHDLLIKYDHVMVGEAAHLAPTGRFISYDWTQDDAMMRLIRRMTGYVYA